MKSFQTIMDNPNAEFKETFEYLLSPSELAEQKLVLTIKTKKKLFSNNMIGQVIKIVLLLCIYFF